MKQIILRASKNYTELDNYLKENRICSFLLVCDASFPYLTVQPYFEGLKKRMGIDILKFDKFQPNPTYEAVLDGVRMLRESKCEAIFAVGGGSAIDVAKCIKLYCNMEGDGEEGAFLRQTIVPNNIKLLAVPTTAGTGSEATKYAVIYYQGQKQSVSHESCIPETVLMDPGTLKTLPLYQKKATAMDALCHGIESFWSLNSTDESKIFSRNAIGLLLENLDDYLENHDEANGQMQQAAYLAGKAINITQTTAGHAMCYRLTSLYGIAHGHAAALCVNALWPWMITHTEECYDPRGRIYLEGVFDEIAHAMGCCNAAEAAEYFSGMLKRLGLQIPCGTENDYKLLTASVNTTRLKNNPIKLDENALNALYHKIVKEAKQI